MKDKKAPRGSAWKLFKSWAKNTDEKKLYTRVGTVLLVFLWFATPFPYYIIVAGAAATYAVGFEYVKKKPTTYGLLYKFVVAAVLFGVFGALRWALGSGVWAAVILLLVALGYKMYAMRGFVRLWWLWYKHRLKRAWSGELRSEKKSFNERIQEALRGGNR